MSDVLVTAQAAGELATAVLRAYGAPDAAAEAQSGQLVEAELRGRPSHGLQRLPVIVKRIRRNLIRPGAEPRFHWLSPAFVRVDGGLGLGPPVAASAIDRLVTRSRQAGVSVAAIARTSHLGMLAPYLERAVAQGVLVVGLTTSEALVHPFGGTRPLIGTNPIGLGIPTSDQAPFILDMATGAISKGAIIAAAERGATLPAGAAIDSAGLPTIDPIAAAGGAISPFGGAKGYGLGLGVELLVALTTATAMGKSVRGTLDTEHPVTKGDLFVVIDPGALALDTAIARATAFLTEVRDSPPAAGHEAVEVPGDRARRARADRLKNGFDVPTRLWDRLLRALEPAATR